MVSAAFATLTSPGSGIVLVWVVVLVSSVVAGVCTWWWHGVCVWGGSVASVERNPLLGERGACVAPIGVVWGPGAGDQRRGRVNASERSPLLGVLVASLGGSAGPGCYPRQKGALAGRPLGVWSGCQQGAHAWVCAR